MHAMLVSNIHPDILNENTAHRGGIVGLFFFFNFLHGNIIRVAPHSTGLYPGSVGSVPTLRKHAHVIYRFLKVVKIENFQ